MKKAITEALTAEGLKKKVNPRSGKAIIEPVGKSKKKKKK